MRRFVPDEVLPSVLDIDLSSLKRRKIKGLLIDLDNTLVGWGESHMEPGFAAWIKQAREAGFEVCLVSNAMPDRVDAFASELDIPRVSKAMKPLRRAFCRALRVLGLETHEAAVIGDQLFTDVYGGNRLGLYTILINPLSTRELRTTRLVRRLERRLFRTMIKRGLVSPAVMTIRGRRGHG